MPDRQQLDNAAEAALYMQSLERDPKVEHMGGLFTNGDGYQQTQETVDGSGQHVRGTLSKPKDAQWGGLYHNHPPGGGKNDKLGEQFSDDDKAMARRLGIPSYISTPSGRTKRFDPVTNTTEDVLADFPIEQYIEYIARRHRIHDLIK